MRTSRREGPRFRPPSFADALSAAAAHSDAAFAELGFGPATVAALRASAAQWRTELLNATDISAPDAVRSTGGRALPGWKLLTIPIHCDHLNVIGRRLPTPVETAHRGRAESAGIIGGRGAGWVFADGWSYSVGPRYYRLSRPDTSWCTTCSQAGDGSHERLRNLRNAMWTSRPSHSGQGQVR